MSEKNYALKTLVEYWMPENKVRVEDINQYRRPEKNVLAEKVNCSIRCVRRMGLVKTLMENNDAREEWTYWKR